MDELQTTEKDACYFSLKSDLEGGCSKLINFFKNKEGFYPEELSNELLKDLSIIPSFKKYPENYIKWAKEKNFELKEEKAKEEEAKPLFKEFGKLTDFLYLAQEFIEKYPLYYDKARLWWRWDFEKYCWEMIDETDILNSLDRETEMPSAKSHIKAEILESLRRKARLNKPENAPESWVQFKDKIYNIENDEVFKASPKYFLSNPINWKLGESEDTPAMDILFKEWVGEEHYQELYELMAFCIVPCYFIHRLFCLIGSGSNGKSTFLNVLSQFIGEENIVSSSLDMLFKQRFEGSKLLKRLVCLMGETNFGIINNTDFLKKLTGQDLVRAEFKGKDCFDFKNYAKLIMATNSLPPTSDKTIGFYRRWKIIDFPNQFKEESDVLINVLDEEYENLALKCLNIAKKLWNHRVFTNDGDFEERKRIYEEKSNPLKKFINDEYERDVNKQIAFGEFFETLNNYLEERGHRTLSAIAVSRQLKNEGFDVKQLTKEGSTTRFILGITPKIPQIPQIPQHHIQSHVYETSGIKGYSGYLGYLSPKTAQNPIGKEEFLEEFKKS